MYSTTILSLKTYVSEKRSQQVQTRNVEGPFDHICTCFCSPSKFAFSVGTSQYRFAIRPLTLMCLAAWEQKTFECIKLWFLKPEKLLILISGLVTQNYNSYKYLGTYFPKSGSALNARKLIAAQARKTMHFLNMRINNLNLPVDLQLKLFDNRANCNILL